MPRPSKRHGSHHHFDALLTFVDVVYGATVGYCFTQIAAFLRNGMFEPWRVNPMYETDVDEVAFWMMVFVLNAIVHRYAEMRMMLAHVSYQRASRFCSTC